ncbi:MAG TPA: hypothetical protein VJ385_00860 [Fibrobacteria bacterium]|nr:hypothetical protein [Fibrobacteria bacterium]
MKTPLAIFLGLGFLALDLHAKPSVAFLGLSRESDPQVSEAISRRIQWELGADTALFAYPREEIALLFAKGVLLEPEAGPMDMPKLSKGLGAQYYAFGALEPIGVQSKRSRWLPWRIKVKWSQALRLRVLDGSNGTVVFDGLVTAEVPEKALFSAPDGNLRAMSPLERETWLRTLGTAVSVESAKALAKVLKEKAAGAAGGEKAKPQGG